MAVDFTKNKAALAGMLGFFSDKNRSAHQKQEQEHTPMNITHATPATSSQTGCGASDLMELAAVNSTTVLTTAANAHGQKDLLITPNTTDVTNTNNTPRNH